MRMKGNRRKLNKPRDQIIEMKHQSLKMVQMKDIKWQVIQMKDVEIKWWVLVYKDMKWKEEYDHKVKDDHKI